ncbi:hypothetical protein DM01DRAFT_1333983 [Hesseltinella vesiculosa]|uniref:Uncharacterized protein n=1 Tax=Hesseltinella vesiculosa TaxID=101127 RepID=A0A1X2GPR3_9FUNG|nr:hypothetical protein DM01DRAFT_1333983 [Hesseltinella vesiculosa]
MLFGSIDSWEGEETFTKKERLGERQTLAQTNSVATYLASSPRTSRLSRLE